MCVSLKDCVQWRPSQRTLSYEDSSTLGRLHKPRFNSHKKAVLLNSLSGQFSYAAADTFMVYELDLSFVFKLP